MIRFTKSLDCIAKTPSFILSINRTFLTKQDRLRLIKENKAAPSHLRHQKLDPKEHNNVTHESIPQEMHKPIQTKDHTEIQSSDKLLWYNDPYLLSKKISELLQDANNADEAIQLVDRHKGAANVQVYGTLLKGLASLGLNRKVLKLYHEMKRKNMDLTPKGITGLLNSIADAAMKPEADRTSLNARLLEAQNIFDALEQVSLIHVNVMLKLYYACKDVGGWDFAWRLFERLGPRTKSETGDEEGRDPLGDLIPDNFTFTIMIKFCARAKTEAATKIGLQLWEDVQRLNSQPRTTEKIHIDTPLLNSVLMLYVHGVNFSDTEKGLEFIHDTFGLPLLPNEKVKQLKKRVTVETLTLLIQFATHIRCPSLGLAWFNIIRDKGLKDKYEKFDEGVYNCLSEMMIEAGEFSRLNQILEKSRRVPFGLKLRVYATALRMNAPEPHLWWHRANKILETKGPDLFKFHDIFHYVECGILTNNFSHVTSIALNRQSKIIEWTKARFVKALKRTLESPTVTLKLNEVIPDIRLLRWIRLAATQTALVRFDKDQVASQSLKALLAEVQYTLNIWEKVEKKHMYAKFALKPLLGRTQYIQRG